MTTNHHPAAAARFTGTIDVAGISRQIRTAVRVSTEATDMADALSARGTGSKGDLAMERSFRTLAILAADKAALLCDFLETAAS